MQTEEQGGKVLPYADQMKIHVHRVLVKKRRKVKRETDKSIRANRP